MAPRHYLHHLDVFLRSLDLTSTKPAPALVHQPPRIAGVHALAADDGACAVYIQGDGVARLCLALPTGPYEAAWYDPGSGSWGERVRLDAAAGILRLAVPGYRDDVALHVRPVPPAGA